MADARNFSVCAVDTSELCVLLHFSAVHDEQARAAKHPPLRIAYLCNAYL